MLGNFYYMGNAQHILQCIVRNKQHMQTSLCELCLPGQLSMVNWSMCTSILKQQERDSYMLATVATRGETLHDIPLLVGEVGKNNQVDQSIKTLTSSVQMVELYFTTRACLIIIRKVSRYYCPCSQARRVQ